MSPDFRFALKVLALASVACPPIAGVSLLAAELTLAAAVLCIAVASH